MNQGNSRESKMRRFSTPNWNVRSKSLNPVEYEKKEKTEVDETEIIFPQSMVIKQQTRFLGLSREWNILN